MNDALLVAPQPQPQPAQQPRRMQPQPQPMEARQPQPVEQAASAPSEAPPDLLANAMGMLAQVGALRPHIARDEMS